MNRSLAPPLSVLLLATMACQALRGAATPSQLPPSATPGDIVPAATPFPDTPTPQAAAPDLWACFGCPGDRAWLLESSGARLINLPVPVGQFYDYSPATREFVYASHFADHGAGPGNVAVSDLWRASLDGGSTALVAEDVVVEARLMPDGKGVVYVRAQSDTYQLRLLRADGEDQLLASEVAFTFSPSPSGDRIAFTRESGYEVTGPGPGLYSVRVDGSDERLLSELDRAGAGGQDDLPVWSPDGRYIFLSNLGPNGEPMLLAAADGSADHYISFAPALSNANWFERTITHALWFPNNRSLLGLASLEEGPGMGGREAAVRYDLDVGQGEVVAGREIAPATSLLQWHRPGEAAWITSPESDGPVLLTIEPQ